VLKSSGLEPLYGARELRKTPPEKRQATERAYNTYLPLSDIAFFLGLPANVVAQNMQRTFGDTGTRRRYIKQFGYGGNKDSLGYRHASQIYEAQDWDLTKAKPHIYLILCPMLYNMLCSIASR